MPNKGFESKELPGMPNKGFESWLKPLILTIIGGIILAFIIGEGSLFQGKSLVDHVNNVKATIEVSKSICEIEVINNLLVPVNILIDNEYLTTLNASSKQKLEGPFHSKGLFFESDTPYAAGINISGYFYYVIQDNGVYTIGNSLGDSLYFLLELNNESSLSCDVYVNRGLENEEFVGKIGELEKNFNSGYFRLYSNSNVVADCSGGISYIWGEYQENGRANDIADIVDNGSGLLELTIPAP